MTESVEDLYGWGSWESVRHHAAAWAWCVKHRERYSRLLTTGGFIYVCESCDYERLRGFMSLKINVARSPLKSFDIAGGQGAPLDVPAILNDNGSLTLDGTPPMHIDCVGPEDPPTIRPAQAGDTLSMEPHGYWQARPSSVPIGAAEKFTPHATLPLLSCSYMVPQSVEYALR